MSAGRLAGLFLQLNHQRTALWGGKKYLSMLRSWAEPRREILSESHRRPGWLVSPGRYRAAGPSVRSPLASRADLSVGQHGDQQGDQSSLTGSQDCHLARLSLQWGHYGNRLWPDVPYSYDYGHHFCHIHPNSHYQRFYNIRISMVSLDTQISNSISELKRCEDCIIKWYLTLLLFLGTRGTCSQESADVQIYKTQI